MGGRSVIGISTVVVITRSTLVLHMTALIVCTLPTVPGVVSLRMCVARPSRGVVGAGAAVSRTDSAAAILNGIFGGCVFARATSITLIKRLSGTAFAI